MAPRDLLKPRPSAHLLDGLSISPWLVFLLRILSTANLKEGERSRRGPRDEPAVLLLIATAVTEVIGDTRIETTAEAMGQV